MTCNLFYTALLCTLPFIRSTTCNSRLLCTSVKKYTPSTHFTITTASISNPKNQFMWKSFQSIRNPLVRAVVYAVRSKIISGDLNSIVCRVCCEVKNNVIKCSKILNQRTHVLSGFSGLVNIFCHTTFCI